MISADRAKVGPDRGRSGGAHRRGRLCRVVGGPVALYLLSRPRSQVATTRRPARDRRQAGRNWRHPPPRAAIARRTDADRDLADHRRSRARSAVTPCPRTAGASPQCRRRPRRPPGGRPPVAAPTSSMPSTRPSCQHRDVVEQREPSSHDGDYPGATDAVVRPASAHLPPPACTSRAAPGPWRPWFADGIAVDALGADLAELLPGPPAAGPRPAM